MIRKIFRFFKETQARYLISHSFVRILKGAEASIAHNVKIRSSRIYVASDARLIIKDGVVIRNTDIYVQGGTLIIDQNSILCGEDHKKMVVTINDGSMEIGHHTKIQCKRIWIRFGGHVEIGSYTNINEGSEIRSDESVVIGDYNQISYMVNIWDTNTHNIYPIEKRAELTRKYYPYYGYEYERPKSKPIVIGDHCWIGERVSLLKGTQIGNNVIVGYNTLLSNERIEDNKKVIQKTEIRIL